MSKEESNGFGFWGVVAIGLVGAMIHSSRERSEEEKRRRNSTCKFSDGITKAQFDEIVCVSRKGIKRLTGLSAIGPIVYGTVRSNSGLSEWSFRIDFNDYGHITGEYWLFTDNHDSTIPKIVAERIADLIRSLSDPDSFYNSFDAKNSKEEIRQIKRQKREQKGRKFVRTLLLSLVCGILFFVFLYWFSENEKKKEIRVGVSSENVVGNDYEEVVKELENNGFTNVFSAPESDLEYKDKNLEYKVSRVEIGDKTTFSLNSKFPYDTYIRVVYHRLKFVYPPISAKDAKKMNYQEVKKQFEDAGFGKVSIVADTDLLFGWRTKDGEVKSVTVDGDAKYKDTVKYQVDTDVVITYHTFKDKK